MTNEIILIVDDEADMRQTVLGWLDGQTNIEVFAASDTEEALRIAEQTPIDLAILDWNLGAGTDGLSLLNELHFLQPDIVAILMTGYAQDATPLKALRQGVRDYLDKDARLFTREAFLTAVHRQLERIRPLKRQREFYRSLEAFREAVEKVLPLVRSSAALNDPVPLPEAIRALFRFLLRGTHASDGALLLRQAEGDGTERTLAFDAKGSPLMTPVPFAQSLAASVASKEGASILHDPTNDPGSASFRLQPFETGKRSILAAPMQVAPGILAILELFDKQTIDGFNENDRRLAGAAGEFGAELLRQALAERQTQGLLFDAVDAALTASTRMAADWKPGTEPPTGPPAEVMERLKVGLDASVNAVVGGEESLRLAEAVRMLAVRHGPLAVQHCTTLVEGVHQLLDAVLGGEE